MRINIHMMCIAIILIMTAWAIPTSWGTTYYMARISDGGNDINDGSIGYPWATLAKAMTELHAGDTLQIRGGTYYNQFVICNASGTSSAWITIESYPNETVCLSGGVPYYEVTQKGEWTLVDGSIGLYRSTRTGFVDQYLYARLLDYGCQIMRYQSLPLLSSTDYDGDDGYVGPGLCVNNGYIYIRLKPNPNDLYDINNNPLPAIPPADSDPNDIRIRISTQYRNILLSNANYIKFKGIEFDGASNSIRISNSSNIVVDDCTFRFRSYAIVNDDSVTSVGYEIKNCTFDMGFPKYMYWSDVKSGNMQAYYAGWNSFAIIAIMKQWNVHDNIFISCFDGIYCLDSSQDSSIKNNIILCSRDDAIDLQPSVSNIEVGYNVIKHCYEGISICGGNTANCGTVYVHHNIIDVSLYHRRNRPGYGLPTFEGGIVFGQHSSDPVHEVAGKQWNIYNNTIVANDPPGDNFVGYDNPDGADKMYNNVILTLSNNPLSTMQNSAGNIYWRCVGGLYGFYEPQGMEVDPILDYTGIQSENYDLARLANPFCPLNTIIDSPGISYESLGVSWPGSVAVDYRGAIGKGHIIGQWQFDESTGATAFDSSPLGNNGTLSGDSHFTIAGKIENALALDGVGDVVSIVRTGKLLNLGAMSFTISCWFKNGANYQYFFSNNMSGTSNLSLNRYRSALLRLMVVWGQDGFIARGFCRAIMSGIC